jgi:hypothetical protein
MAEADNAVKKASSYLKAQAGAHKFSMASAALSFAPGMYFRTRQGDSVTTAFMKEIPSTVAWAVAPGVMWAVTGAQLAPALAQGYMNANNTLRGKYNANHRPGTMFSYTDTQQAATMRQAAVQAIQGSKMNARNALGGEAALMHRGYGDRMGLDW